MSICRFGARCSGTSKPKTVAADRPHEPALIVRDDADLDAAVAFAVAGAFTNAGQMCSATARILVHDSLYRGFMAAFETAVRALVVAPPDAANVAMGPLISAAHRARVESMLRQGIDSGAQVAFTGRVADARGDGYFMAPVVSLSGIGREPGVAGLRSYQGLRHAVRAVD